MSFFDKFLFYVSVPKCVCCGERLEITDRALCRGCRAKYDDAIRRNCSICGKPLYECTCPNDFLDSHYVHKIVKVFRYIIKDELPTNSLIYSLKRDNRRDVLAFLSEELANAIAFSIKEPDKYLFTSVPRRARAIINYGFDHSEILSRAVAKKLNAKYEKLLISRSKAEQKKAGDKLARLANVDFRLRKKSIDLTGRNIIIVDDIVTSGASMGTSAMLLKGAGARRIVGAALAIAYKDSYTPFNSGDRFGPI